jgi:hypothetical protein
MPRVQQSRESGTLSTSSMSPISALREPPGHQLFLSAAAFRLPLRPQTIPMTARPWGLVVSLHKRASLRAAQ